MGTTAQATIFADHYVRQSSDFRHRAVLPLPLMSRLSEVHVLVYVTHWGRRSPLQTRSAQQQGLNLRAVGISEPRRINLEN